MDKEIDEGFGDVSEEDTVSQTTLMASESDITVAPPDDSDSDSDVEEKEEKANDNYFTKI